MSMNRRDGYIDDDTRIIDGHRVRIPELITVPGKGVTPSYGYKKRVMTPWGEPEVCDIIATPSLLGGTERYAQVYRPKSNPGVSIATFRLT